MRNKILFFVVAGSLLLAFGYRLGWLGSGGAPDMVISEAPGTATLRGAAWPAVSLMTAHMMIEKYGPPQAVYPDRVIWGAHWPWRRIVVSASTPSAPLEQVVAYRVPPDKLSELARFSHGLVIYSERGELGARSDREDLNRLALNLAHDIVKGRRTAEQASAFYLRMSEFVVAGRSSPYTKRLLFPIAPPDRFERFPMDRF